MSAYYLAIRPWGKNEVVSRAPPPVLFLPGGRIADNSRKLISPTSSNERLGVAENEDSSFVTRSYYRFLSAILSPSRGKQRNVLYGKITWILSLWTPSFC